MLEQKPLNTTFNNETNKLAINSTNNLCVNSDSKAKGSKGKPGRKRKQTNNTTSLNTNTTTTTTNNNKNLIKESKKSFQLNTKGKKSKGQRKKLASSLTSGQKLVNQLAGTSKSLNNPTSTSSSSSINNTNNNNNINNNNSSVVGLNDAAILRLINDPNTFSLNALFHSPSSLLTKLDLKALFHPSIFESLPRQSQLKLIKLLPECDRQLDSHGSFK